MLIEKPEEIEAKIQELGFLHDVYIAMIVIDTNNSQITIFLDDIYAAFEGEESYRFCKGPTTTDACTIFLIRLHRCYHWLAA